MKKQTKKRGDAPRFDLLLLACLGVVALIGVIVWVTTSVFPEYFL